jgi:hypothetical protein
MKRGATRLFRLVAPLLSSQQSTSGFGLLYGVGDRPDDLVHATLVTQALLVLTAYASDGCAGDDSRVASIGVKSVKRANLLRILREVIHLADAALLDVGCELRQLVELNPIAPPTAAGRVVVGDEELSGSLVKTVNPAQVIGLLVGSICVLGHEFLLSSSS